MGKNVVAELKKQTFIPNLASEQAIKHVAVLKVQANKPPFIGESRRKKRSSRPTSLPKCY